MIIADCHSHSDFSGDCEAAMADMAEAAIAKSLRYLAVTEHHDLDFPPCGIDFELDIDSYFPHISDLKARLEGRLTLLAGLEIGMQTHLHPVLGGIVGSREYDFILASSHLADGKDPYDAGFFSGRTRDQGYRDYFRSILEQIEGFEDFDAYGHLDYVIRYWPGEDKQFEYKEFQDVLDPILETLIRKGKAIEVNTSGYRYGLGQPHPSYGILQRYYELGGRRITIGSDAHRPEDLASMFREVETRLKAIGFDGYLVHIKRQPFTIPFDGSAAGA